MVPCKCFVVQKQIKELTEFEKGVIFGKTGVYKEEEVIEKKVCSGTKDCQECSCGGDQCQCTFYPEIACEARDFVARLDDEDLRQYLEVGRI